MAKAWIYKFDNPVVIDPPGTGWAVQINYQLIPDTANEETVIGSSGDQGLTVTFVGTETMTAFLNDIRTEVAQNVADSFGGAVALVNTDVHLVMFGSHADNHEVTFGNDVVDITLLSNFGGSGTWLEGSRVWSNPMSIGKQVGASSANKLLYADGSGNLAQTTDLGVLGALGEDREISTSKTIAANTSEVIVGPVTVDTGQTITFADTKSRLQILGGAPTAMEHATGSVSDTYVASFEMVSPSVVLTPRRTGNVLVLVYGTASNGVNAINVIFSLRYGLGTPPNLLDPITGTQISLASKIIEIASPAGSAYPWSISGLVTGLIVDKQYWFMMSNSSGVVVLLPTITAVEI